MTGWADGLPLRAGDMTLGVYQPSPETTGFWEGVEKEELRLKQCADCDAWHHPRRIMCTECRSLNLIWTAASGEATLYSFSEIHRATGAFAASVPYIVGIVRLAEGVHIFSRILAEARAPAIGAPLKLQFRTLEEGHQLPVFALAEINA